MAKQRYINTKFWEDSYISNLDPSEKLVFLYLLTNSATNITGVYEIPLKRIASDTGFDKEMIVKIVDRFSKDGKVKYTEGWVLIKNFIKHQNQNSPQVKKGIEAELKAIPDSIKKELEGMHTLSHLNLIKSNSNITKYGEREAKASPHTKFNRPSVQEVSAYVVEKGFSVDAGRFCDYYESKGWVVGKSPMKDWKAAVRTWAANEKKTAAKKITVSEFMKLSPEKQEEVRKSNAV